MNININRDDSNLNDFLICWDIFQCRPNKLIIHKTYQSELFYEILNDYIKEKTSLMEIIPTTEEEIINDKVFAKISDNIYITYIELDRNSENPMISDFSFIYKQENELIKEIISKLDECIIEFNDDEFEINKLNIATLSPENNVEIEPIEYTKKEEFRKFYSKKTYKEINKLIKDISDNNKGLSILYGERGTGKTSVICNITDKIDKPIIFIPNSMIESAINNPNFRKTFQSYRKSVIVIDDCEMIFNEFFNKSNIFVNNLIQMIDGLISDEIEINIILIFNVDNESEIDHSLLECNNLLRMIEFSDLSSNEATELSEFLGHNKKYKEKVRVLDVVKNRKYKEKSEIGL